MQLKNAESSDIYRKADRFPQAGRFEQQADYTIEIETLMRLLGYME